MALAFDGVDDQVDHGDINAVDGAANLTWMYWLFRPSGSAPAGITKGSLFLVYAADSTDDLACGESAVWEKAVANSLTADTQLHVAFSYDGSAADPNKIAILIGGVAQTVTGSNPGVTLAASASSLIVGKHITGFGAGRIAAFKMWTATLTPAQMAQEVHSARPVRTANLLLWCPYDDGTSARDYSGNGNHGTVTGALPTAGPLAVGGAPVLVS